MFMLGLCIIGACTATIARYDPKDPDNAAMLFIMENSFQVLLRLMTILNLGRAIVLFALCRSLTTWL